MELRRHWDEVHREWGRRSTGPTSFGRECAALMAAASSVLELGCGPGEDAAFFAGLGHRVRASDFSGVAIEKNQRRYGGQANLDFCVVDTGGGLPFAAGAFDVVYARLSLHYFSDERTGRVFQDIRRVLRPGGLLFFLCKSVDDPLYGLGRLIEADMYEIEGHVRHFFSAEYARSCLAGEFEVVRVETDDDQISGRQSCYVKVFARAR